MKNNTFFYFCSGLFGRIIFVNFASFFVSLFVFGISSGSVMRVAIQILCFIALISTVYSFSWKRGDLDSPLVSSKAKNYQPLKGLKAGLIANLPFICSGIVLILSKSTGILERFVNYYKIINSFYFPFNYSILPADLSIWEMSWGNIFLSLCTLLFIPLLSAIAYVLGIRRFSFAEFFFYKKT